MYTSGISKSILFVAGVSLSILGSKAQAFDYFGDFAKVSEFSFNAAVILPKSAGQPTEESLNKEVKLVTKYILGHMDDDGSISYAFKTKIIKVESASNTNYKVSYSFKGKGVFKSEFGEYEFYVPVMPRQIHALADGKCQDEKATEVDSGNFWYDWKPEVQLCPLVEGEHYLKIKAALKVIPSTVETYPEYEKLIVNNKMTVTMFFGASDHSNSNWNPLAENHEDYGAHAYQQTRQHYIDMGYSVRQITEAELRTIYTPKDSSKLPFGEELTKTGENGRSMQIRMYFLETQSTNNRSEGFHYFLRRVLKTDSVVMYDGHSGLGENLNLNKIEARHGFEIKLNPNYQLIYFGSCIPYAYYSDMFLKRKVTKTDINGTKNLDVLAYARESHFGNTENLRLISALDKYVFTDEKTSYQMMVTGLPTDMFGVVGDEDNN